VHGRHGNEFDLVLMLLLYSRMQQASKVRQYPSHGMAKRRPPSTPPAGRLRLFPSPSIYQYRV
jgi:hypothetical protein